MSNIVFNEDKFNMDTRKFLKKVGINSQREIERAVNEALQAGKLSGDESLKAEITLKIGDLDINFKIDGEIALS